MAQDQPPNDSRRQAGGGRPGRRPGRPGTRETIIEAAYHAFTTIGFREATAKSIADDAGVDPAMINYFFGSKQGLFREVLYRHHGPASRQAQVAEGTGEDSVQAAQGADFPERLVREMICAWDRPGTRKMLTGLLLSAGDDPKTSEMVRAVGESTGGVVEKHLVNQGMAPAKARHRSALIVAMNMGVLYARYIVDAPQLTDMAIDEIVAEYAPAIRELMSTT